MVSECALRNFLGMFKIKSEDLWLEVWDDVSKFRKWLKRNENGKGQIKKKKS